MEHTSFSDPFDFKVNKVGELSKRTLERVNAISGFGTGLTISIDDHGN